LFGSSRFVALNLEGAFVRATSKAGRRAPGASRSAVSCRSPTASTWISRSAARADSETGAPRPSSWARSSGGGRRRRPCRGSRPRVR